MITNRIKTLRFGADQMSQQALADEVFDWEPD